MAARRPTSPVPVPSARSRDMRAAVRATLQDIAAFAAMGVFLYAASLWCLA